MNSDTVMTEIADSATAMKDSAAQFARTTAELGKDTLADGGQRLAETLRNVATDQGEDSVQGRVLGAVAGGVADVSESLRGRSFGALVSEAQGLASRNPGIFVLGAAVAGFALARFGRAGGWQSLPDTPHERSGS